VTGPASPAGYLVSHHQNDAFVAVNRLLAAGEEVYWLSDRNAGPPSGGRGWIYIAARPTTRAILDQAASDLGLTFAGVTAASACLKPSSDNGTSTSRTSMSMVGNPASCAASRATLPWLCPCRTSHSRSGQFCRMPSSFRRDKA
jgi:hypothetical protein